MRAADLSDEFLLIRNTREPRWNGHDIAIIPHPLLVFRTNPNVRFNFPVASPASECSSLVVLLRWSSPSDHAAWNAELMIVSEFWVLCCKKEGVPYHTQI
jgi:hypothetical protein